jgi:hypothetical protein
MVNDALARNQPAASRQGLPLVLATGVILIFARLLPLPHHGRIAGLPPLCPMKAFSGIPCPGCGMTRSFVLCAHGHWQDAFANHPLGPPLFAVFCLAFVAGLSSLFFKFELPTLRDRRVGWAGFSFLAVLVVTWIIRMTGFIPFPAGF